MSYDIKLKDIIPHFSLTIKGKYSLSRNCNKITLQILWISMFFPFSLHIPGDPLWEVVLLGQNPPPPVSAPVKRTLFFFDILFIKYTILGNRSQYTLIHKTLKGHFLIRKIFSQFYLQLLMGKVYRTKFQSKKWRLVFKTGVIMYIQNVNIYIYSYLL